MISPALEAELAEWRALRCRPRLWWRDDDARRPTPQLDRLLALADKIPLALAIIPSGNVYALGKCLSGLANVTIAQHGVDHVNRRAPGASPGENPLGASAGQITARIAAGRERMTLAGLKPALFVPPWNRIDEALPDAVRASGFGVMSAWGGLGRTRGKVRRLDAHLDVMAWTRPARFKGAARLIEVLRRGLVRRRTARAPAVPIGLLTHHLSHDAAAWSFLDAFVAWVPSEFEWAKFDLNAPLCCSPA